MPCARDQSCCKRCEPRADLDDVVAGSRIDGIEDARDVVRIGEEILTEPAAGRVSFQWGTSGLISALLEGPRRRLMLPLRSLSSRRDTGSRELDSQVHGCEHAAWIGGPRKDGIAGQIERGPVID